MSTGFPPSLSAEKYPSGDALDHQLERFMYNCTSHFREMIWHHSVRVCERTVSRNQNKTATLPAAINNNSHWRVCECVYKYRRHQLTGDNYSSSDMVANTAERKLIIVTLTTTVLLSWVYYYYLYLFYFVRALYHMMTVLIIRQNHRSKVPTATLLWLTLCDPEYW